MIKAAFFDVDGTLVSFKTHKVAQSTINALDKLREKGIKLIVSTGRHKGQLDFLDEFYKFDAYVTLNGQYCCAEAKTIYKNPIEPADIKSLCDMFKTIPVPCLFIEEHENYLNFANEAVTEEYARIALGLPPIKDIGEAYKKDIYQLVFFADEQQEREIMPFLPNCTTTRWHPSFMDVMPADGGKHIGISKMLEHYGIKPDEIIAFGDGGNDVTMLEFAGLGVAMGNAADDVKAHADYVTTSVDDDGVANALMHFGLID